MLNNIIRINKQCEDLNYKFIQAESRVKNKNEIIVLAYHEEKEEYVVWNYCNNSLFNGSYHGYDYKTTEIARKYAIKKFNERVKN